MLLLRSLFFWLTEPRQLVAGLVSSMVIASALAVAYSAHQTRNMYRELQRLEKNHDDLEHGYEMLLLEQSAWADYSRLDQLAHEKLAMTAPDPADTVILP